MISLSASTKYWLILGVAATSGSNYYKCQSQLSAIAPSGDFGDADEVFGSGSDLAGGFSAQWTWDLNFRVCVAGDALNKYFYLTIASADISLKSFLKNYFRSSRTGGFLSQSFGEAAIGEQLFAVSIGSANQWELKASDITGVAAASRDAVTKIGFKVTNMDEDAIIYFDDIFANIGEPRPALRRGSDIEYYLTSGAFDLALLRSLALPFLMKAPGISYSERTTAGTTTLTVGTGKVWLLLHAYFSGDGVLSVDDIQLPATNDTKMKTDTVLAYGDHMDLTVTFIGTIRVWYLEIDADPVITPKTMIQLTAATTYTVPNGYTLIVTRVVNTSGSANNLIADSKDILDCNPEARDFVAIFDEATVLKATASSLRFIGFLIPKTM